MVFLRLNDQILGEVQKRFKDNQVTERNHLFFLKHEIICKPHVNKLYYYYLQDVIKPCDAALAKLKNTKAH